MSSEPEIVGGFMHMLAIALVGSGTGRLVWHAMEVNEGRRRLFGWAILVELLIAAFMALLAAGVADQWDLKPAALAGLAAMLGYLGPKGLEFWARGYLARRAQKTEGKKG